MEKHFTPNKTPSKFLENIREAVARRNLSPFLYLPNNHSTPPSRFFKIKNPFDAALNDRLHMHVLSPSVFVEEPKDDQLPVAADKFKWTIDEVAELQPAQIDESTIVQFEHNSRDSDVHVQEKIEKFFSEKHIVPSPWTQNTALVKLMPEIHSSPIKEEAQTKETCNVWTQTNLSLPPKLSEELEKALLPYFTFTENQQRQSVDLNSSLCRRLFNFETSDDSDTNSCLSSIKLDLSNMESPIVETSEKRKRHFDSPAVDLAPPELSPIHNSTPRKLNNCELSRISTSDMQYRSVIETNNDLAPEAAISPICLVKKSRNCLVPKLDFSGHMSVDTSFNMASENDPISVQNQTDLSVSPLRTSAFMDSSANNWDLEYNQIAITINRSIRRSLFEQKAANHIESMDISHLTTTPKSKSVNSQRKKLSDSFKFSDSLSDDEELENFDEFENPSSRSRRLNFCDNEKNASFPQNTQDTGYSTELSQRLTENLTETAEDMMVADHETHIFASTPSKRYFYNTGV